MLRICPRPSSRHRSRRGGFTIIEMLIVISIIGLLIAMIASVGSYVQLKGQEDATRARVQALHKAALIFYKHHQQYPANVAAMENIPECAAILDGIPAGDRSKDAFGRTISFQKTGGVGGSLLVLSYGANGSPYDADDIRSDDR